MNIDITSTLVTYVQSLSSNAEGAAITADTQLFTDGVLTSMNILDLIGFIEEQVGRKLSDSELLMANFTSITAMQHAFFHE